MNPVNKSLRAAITLFILLCAPRVRGAMTVGSWSPIFKGVDSSVSENTPSASMPNQHVVYALRVDLTDPDIHFRSTPRVPSNYQNNIREVIGQTVSDFMVQNQLQVAINANFFDSPGYFPPPGTAFNVLGLAMDQGTNVSVINSPSQAASLILNHTNGVTFIPTNYPAKPLTNAYTAVTGEITILLNGVNRMTRDADVQPRTVFGLSTDRHHLYLVAFDGRQSGYSDGATLYECAEWLRTFGASDAINMDGGGSTLIVTADSTGAPVRMNSSSAVAGFGKERVVGSHLGFTAKPVPSFFSDVLATPDDTSALLTWTTSEAATTEVRYGVSSELELGSVFNEQLTNTHQLTLSNLTPGTQYYFQILATASQTHTSAQFSFTTTNYVTTNEIFDVTHEWRYSYAPLDGVNWTAADYDDSAWSGPSPGLLWADSRATPNPNIQPKGTQMPTDPNAGFPYVTYYFRTTFVLTNNPANSALQFSANIDDGAAFYLNGARVYSLRVPDDATSGTIATGFPCTGDADCLDIFTLPISSSTNLVIGTNVLAAEVHNYNARSPDITFGVALARIEQAVREMNLEVTRADNKVVLNWSSGSFLQSAATVDGPWNDVDPAPTPPLTMEPVGASQFYRVRR